MITSFRHKGLQKFFSSSDHRGIPANFAARIAKVLDRLDSASMPDDLDLPGYKFHALKGNRKGAYAVAISGNLRITFRFDKNCAVDVNLEDYH
jgi:proteic killer suppression protein